MEAQAHAVVIIPLDDEDVYPSAVRTNERGCHQSSLVHQRNFPLLSACLAL